MRSRWIFLVPILLATALRFPALAERPMHADEAIHADKLGTLLETGRYAYDPSEYHGPTLYYLTLPVAWLMGMRRYVDLDESVLRAVPAVLGLALVVAHVALRPFLGLPGSALAALLAAVSPAMVYYSRYYIHEVPLVAFTFGALVGAFHYLRKPGAVAALATGACLGLMHATKETAPIAIGSMLLALALTVLDERRRGRSPRPIRSVVRGRDALLAAAAAIAVSALLYSSFLSYPGGVLDSIRAYAVYADRAAVLSWHVHPWDYYLRLLVLSPAEGTPVWSEGLIIVLALAGAAAGWSASGLPGVDSRIVRFLACYTLLMVVFYAAIPYKTPWCLLGFLHGMILLAGVGGVFLLRSLRGRALKTAVGVALVAAVAQLTWQAYAASFRFAADPRNPYVYAHTSVDVFTIVDRLKQLARAHPEGSAMPMQVISRENLWPLPWYLRRFSQVAWWTGVSDAARSAPVIVVTPDMEAALVHKLYDLPAPGERELYVSLFERPVELRPRVELRGYAVKTLWDAWRRLEAEQEAASGSGQLP